MAYMKGRGTATEPYVINSIAGFLYFLKNDLNKGAYFVLACDVIMQDREATAFSNASANFNIDCLGHVLLLKITASGGPAFSVLSVSFKNGDITIDTANGYFVSGASNNPAYFYDCNVRFVNGVAQGPKCSITRSVVFSSINRSGGSNGFSVGLTISGLTRLDSLANPFDPSLFSSFDKSIWAVDGNSYPRLIPRTIPYITQFYAVKGVVKVGGVPASRRITAHYSVDFHLITESKSSELDGSYTIDCGGYSDHVYVIHSDAYGDKFAASHTYAVGDVIHPDSPNGYRYVCSVAGVSAASAPVAWPATGELVSGGASFTTKAVFAPAVHMVVPVLYDSETGLPV